MPLHLCELVGLLWRGLPGCTYGRAFHVSTRNVAIVVRMVVTTLALTAATLTLTAAAAAWMGTSLSFLRWLLSISPHLSSGAWHAGITLPKHQHSIGTAVPQYFQSVAESQGTEATCA